MAWKAEKSLTTYQQLKYQYVNIIFISSATRKKINSAPAQTKTLEYKDTAGDSIKAFAEVKVNNNSSTPVVHIASLIVEGNEAGQG